MKSNQKVPDEYDGIFNDEDQQILQGRKAPRAKPKESENKQSQDKFRIEDGQYYYDLTQKKRICISQFKGQPMVSLREYFEKDGQILPTKKGISLTLENWQKLKELINDIDQCIKKVKK